ncbi:gliding motility-associated C-terminal domain-containing protein [Spirosoma aerolatum]|uniref:gliding motility-associated C-terminal domain-containing protein n=1 Tax=Spirosoma aerolatum TaxID=1211326 RepID=UPI0009AEBB35|nr:gliding motility-associated C-terminal domain-containing protein [Spirosoma aerolatum]
MAALQSVFCWIVLSLLVLATDLRCQAQCSQGAILCETFGAGTRGALPDGQTKFTYNPIACPEDGEYNVMDTVSGSCHGQAWHYVAQDHTDGDVRGNMFVVNASYQPGEFYSQAVTGLCPGVTYEFSLWALNLNKVMQPGACDGYSLRNPIIVMRIEQTDGTLIREVVQPAIPRTTSPTWVQLTMQFAIQTNKSDIIVKLVNQGLGGCGNDLIIDDIGFRPVHPALSIQFANTTGTQTTACAYSALTLEVGSATGYPNPVYLWQQSRDNVTWTAVPGAGNASYTINPVRAGRTYYRLHNTQPINEAAVGRSQCSAESNVLIVDGTPVATVDLGPPFILCEGASVVFSVPDTLPPNARFVWSDQSTNRRLTITNAGVYWLETRLNACPYRDSVTVVVQNCHLEDTYIPDAFTPNGDAMNDQLQIRHAGTFLAYQFRIFDRWGSVIFTSKDPEHSWDGTYLSQPCETGSYAWTFDYSIRTITNEERRVSKSGWVLLIR